MYCGRCGAANPEGADVRYCRSCGAELADGTLSGQAGGFGAVPPIFAPGGVAPGGAPGGAIQAAVFPYGGFWIRLVAYAIDLLVLIAAGVLLFGVAALPYGDGRGEDGAMGLAALVYYLLALAYVVVLPPTLGATLGKLALGYHIVAADGRHIGYGRSIARVLGTMVSGLFLGLGYIWIGVDARKQGWHDKIAGTYVVRREFVRG